MTDRRTGGLADRRTDRRAGGRASGRADGQADGQADGRTDGQTAGRTDGRTGREDGQTQTQAVHVHVRAQTKAKPSMIRSLGTQSLHRAENRTFRGFASPGPIGTVQAIFLIRECKSRDHPRHLCASMRGCICTSMRLHMITCIVWVRGCVGAWVRACVRACMRACMRACVHSCVLAPSSPVDRSAPYHPPA